MFDTKKHKLKIVLLVVSAGLCQAASASEEELAVNFSYSVIEEENINRGFLENDVHADQINSVTVGLKTEIEISKLSAFFIVVDFVNSRYSDYSKLSSDKITGRLDYVFQTGYRFSDPLYTLSFSVEESDYDSQLRDSTTLGLAAKILKRMTTRIKLSSGLSLTQREADTNVFDIDSARLFVLLDYTITTKWSAYVSHALTKGGSVSTITTLDPDLLAQQIGYATINEADASGALLPDDVFGGFAAGQFAYQNDAQHAVTEFGTNFSFSGQQAIDVSVMTVSTELDTGLTYENYLVLFSYLARF